MVVRIKNTDRVANRIDSCLQTHPLSCHYMDGTNPSPFITITARV